MKHIRTVKASPTHNAYWYSATREELNAIFGQRQIDALIDGLRNGVTSVHNMSEQVSKGLEQHAQVALLMDYPEWKQRGCPMSELHFSAITMGPISGPIVLPIKAHENQQYSPCSADC
ncbi:hypothetical protein ABXZ88_003191 [Vibrio fluvialis]